MSLIANPSAAVNWTLNRERLCDKALEKCGVLAAGEAANAQDRALCIEALEGILKNMLWRGYAWPKTISSKATLTLTAATPNVTLPQDFYTAHKLMYVDASGNEIPLLPMDFSEYSAIPLKTATAKYPSRYYIDNFNVLWVWAVQTANVTANLYYQKVISDTVDTSPVDLDAPWMLGLPYAIAAEVGHEFGVPPDKIDRFNLKWEQQLQLGVMNEAPPAPDRISVDD